MALSMAELSDRQCLVCLYHGPSHYAYCRVNFSWVGLPSNHPLDGAFEPYTNELSL